MHRTVVIALIVLSIALLSWHSSSALTAEGFVSHACGFGAPCNKFAAPFYPGAVSVGGMSEQTRQRRCRARRTAEEARAAQARNTAAHQTARAAAPAEEARAAQARNTAARRDAHAAARAEVQRAPHGEFRRAAGENMPSDASLDNFDVDPVAAIALHHALQYHWQGEDFRDVDFNALDGQQLVAFCPCLTRKACPTTSTLRAA
jgi:hypothetical protein